MSTHPRNHLHKLCLPDRQPNSLSSSSICTPLELSPRSIPLSPSSPSSSSFSPTKSHSIDHSTSTSTSPTAASAPWSLTSDVLQSVVKIYVTHCEPTYARPWQMEGQNYTTSSGFILPDRRILTNAHSIEHFTFVRVKRRGDDTRYVASVLAIAEECDLALLTVPDDAFWHGGLTALPISERLPALRDSVIVAGYPHGGDGMSVTAGVVSRIELLEYTEASNLLSVQIDAAINPGNSGGPAFDSEGKVVGVAFKMMASHTSENIGYLIPTNVVHHFLNDVDKHEHYTGFCSVGFEWNELEAPAMRRYYKVPRDESGILVTGVEYNVQSLEKYDVVTHINGCSISNSGMIHYDPCGERISFQVVISERFDGDSVHLRVYRDGELVEGGVQYKLENINTRKLVPVHLELNGEKNRYVQPSYFVFGGFVFLKLTAAYLKATYGHGYKAVANMPVNLRWLCEHGDMSQDEREIVVLSHVLNCPTNIHYEHFYDERVYKVNDTPVRSLQHMYEAIQEMVGDENVRFVKLQLMDDVIVVDKQEAMECHEDVLTMHHISKDSSFEQASLSTLFERVRVSEDKQ